MPHCVYYASNTTAYRSVLVTTTHWALLLNFSPKPTFLMPTDIHVPAVVMINGTLDQCLSLYSLSITPRQSGIHTRYVYCRESNHEVSTFTSVSIRQEISSNYYSQLVQSTQISAAIDIAQLQSSNVTIADVVCRESGQTFCHSRTIHGQKQYNPETPWIT